MKKLTAIQPTNQDNQIIKASIDAVRSVLERLCTTNNKKDERLVLAPRCMLQISLTEERFTLTLDGHPASPATGRTLEEAVENLSANPDAAFLRRRAQTLIDRATELYQEADKLEGIAIDAIDAPAGTAVPDGTTGPGNAAAEGGAQ